MSLNSLGDQFIDKLDIPGRAGRKSHSMTRMLQVPSEKRSKTARGKR